MEGGGAGRGGRRPAGVAAALSIEQGVMPREVDVPRVQAFLRNMGVKI